MGSKRKPFITSKGVSQALINSGEANGWSAYEVVEIWRLAALHLTEQMAEVAFDQALQKPGISEIFRRSHYKVTGTGVRHINQAPDHAYDSLSILTEKIRCLIKEKWPLAASTDSACQWHDFTDLLLIALMRNKAAPLRFKAKKVERDLGL